MKSLIFAIQAIFFSITCPAQQLENPDRLIKGQNIFFLGDSIPKNDERTTCGTENIVAGLKIPLDPNCKIFRWTPAKDDSISIGGVKFSNVFLEPKDNKISSVQYIRAYYKSDIKASRKLAERDYNRIVDEISFELNAKGKQTWNRVDFPQIQSEFNCFWKIGKTIFKLVRTKTNNADLKYTLIFSYKLDKEDSSQQRHL